MCSPSCNYSVYMFLKRDMYRCGRERAVRFTLGFSFMVVLFYSCGFSVTSASRPRLWNWEKRADSGELLPVVLIPGTGGNQLEVKLSKGYKPGSFWCTALSSGYFRLWLDVVSIIPPFTSCFAERMKLDYNSERDVFQHPPGIQTRVPYFGSTEGMEYLDPNFKSLSPYMSPLVEGLKRAGYVVGESLFGAPYDFRFAPGPHAGIEATTYLKNLKELVESSYAQNGNRKVVLLAHSLGGLWTLYFLNQQSRSWLTKYVSRFLAVSVPWGGTVQEMIIFGSGSTEGVAFLNPLTLRDEQRSSESNLWLLPVPKVFKSKILVTTPSRSYSALDIEDFLKDIGFSDGVKPYKSRIPVITGDLVAPEVGVTIIYGQGVETPEKLIYRKKGFSYQPEVIQGDGDGTVNLCSLTAVISNWESVKGKSFRAFSIPLKTHTSILMDSDAVDVLCNEILSSGKDSS